MRMRYLQLKMELIPTRKTSEMFQYFLEITSLENGILQIVILRLQPPSPFFGCHPPLPSRRSRGKKKLSDMLGPHWSKEELEHFYEAYRKHGRDWRKVAAVLRNRSVEMVEAVYSLNKAYLSLSEGTASVAGFIAMMTDYYSIMEDRDGEHERNDGVGTSRKPQKHMQRKVHVTPSKGSVEWFRLHPEAVPLDHGCLSLLKKKRSGDPSAKEIRSKKRQVKQKKGMTLDDTEDNIEGDIGKQNDTEEQQNDEQVVQCRQHHALRQYGRKKKQKDPAAGVRRSKRRQEPTEKERTSDHNLQVAIGKQTSEQLEAHSETYSDFEKPPPKKHKLSKDRKLAEKSEQKIERPLDIKYFTIRTRTSPKTLFMAIQSLTESQRQCVCEMGFQSLLDMKLDGIPSKLGFYVVQNFDPTKYEINTEKGPIIVTKEAIHDMIGAPIGGVDFGTLTGENVDMEIAEHWRNQYQKTKIRTTDVMRQIVASKEADLNFKLNFIILFTNIMGSCISNGVCNLNILSRINEDTNFAQIDWCGYILECLRNSKNWWKAYVSESFYSGPLTSLVLLYVDSIKCNTFNVRRQRPAIRAWSMEMMRQREAAEIAAGGFGNGEFEERYEPTNDEDEFHVEAGGDALDKPQEKDVEAQSYPQLPSTLEGYVAELDKRLKELIELKMSFEKTLHSALKKFPEANELKQWEAKFRNLFHADRDQDEESKHSDEHQERIEEKDVTEAADKAVGTIENLDVPHEKMDLQMTPFKEDNRSTTASDIDCLDDLSDNW